MGSSVGERRPQLKVRGGTIFVKSRKTEVYVLGSGSSGNSLYLRYGEFRLLIDAGLPARQIKKRLFRFNVSLSDIRAVLVTHEHGDHIQGIKALCKDSDIPVWVNEKTRKASKVFDSLPRVREFQTGASFEVNGVHVDPIPLSHDAADPVCFAVRMGPYKIGVATDLGKVEGPVIQGLRKADVLLIEFNHDREMMENGPYHPNIKERVLGERGHLSNDESASLLARLFHPELKGVILGHISQANNHPDLAYLAARTALLSAGTDLPIYTAHPHHPGPRILL